MLTNTNTAPVVTSKKYRGHGLVLDRFIGRGPNPISKLKLIYLLLLGR